MADPEGFEEFVAVRSGRLLRTAYLLTHDWARAEDLLQTALARAWLAWGRIRTHPDPYVRKIMLNTYASWWRRRWTSEAPTGEQGTRTVTLRFVPEHMTGAWRAVLYSGQT